MVEVIFTEQSLSDIDEIARYIANDSVYYASLQVEKIFNRTDLLSDFPLLGRIVPEVNQKSIRELIEGNYRIIYRIVSKNTIHILTVYHSKRLLKRTVIKRISR